MDDKLFGASLFNPTVSAALSDDGTFAVWPQSIRPADGHLFMGEDGSSLMRVTEPESNEFRELRWYDGQLSGYTVLASSTDFADVVSGSVSSDGRIAAFVGIVSSSASQSVRDQLGSGTAIFTGIKTNAAQVLKRLHGGSGDGVLDAHDTWVDRNSNGEFDDFSGANSEDVGPLAFDRSVGEVESHIVVSHTSRGASGGRIAVTFGASSGRASGGQGIFRMDTVWEGTSAGVRLSIGQPSPLLLNRGLDGIATTIPGAGTISAVRMLDANDQGEFVAGVQTTTGDRYFVTGKSELRPILVLPGIGGSLPSEAGSEEWFLNRGFDPRSLVIDPLLGTYQALIDNLIAAGYVVGENLYLAPYDWRMDPGPTDGNPDGQVMDVVNGTEISLTAESITRARATGEFRYGVDYLGYFLKQAAEDWLLDHNTPLDAVDVIAHSTGGLVTRVYVQSDAYGGEYAPGKRLPTIDTFVMHNVPNQGAPKAWSFLNDDWANDKGLLDYFSYGVFFRKLMNFAFQKMIQSAQGITGADGNITLETLLAGTGLTRDDFEDLYGSSINIFTGESPLVAEVRRRFIRAYVPTLRSLGPTYDFIDERTELSEARIDAMSNRLLADLNHTDSSADVYAFSRPGRIRTIVNVVGTGDSTIVSQRENTGTLFPTFPWIQKFDEFLPNPANRGELFYSPQRSTAGDGTVPRESMVDPFVSDGHVTLREFVQRASAIVPGFEPVTTISDEEVNHNDILKNPDAQVQVLKDIGAPLERSRLSTSGSVDLSAIFGWLWDPAEHPWHNSIPPHAPNNRGGLDVDDDGNIAAGDALLIINYLNSDLPTIVPRTAPLGNGKSQPFYDVDADNQVTAGDALSIINAINSNLDGSVNGEPTEESFVADAGASADGISYSNAQGALDLLLTALAQEVATPRRRPI